MSLLRRAFLRLCAASALCAALPGRALAFVVAAFRTRSVERPGFRFDAATGRVTDAQSPSGRPFELLVDGLVETPLALSYEQLRNLAQTAQTSDFHCVEGWSVLDVRWSGVRLAEIAGLCRPTPKARFVVFHALGRTHPLPSGLDHYLESLPLADLLDPALGYLLALDLDGAPLSHERGAPARLVCPFDLAYKGTKFVTRLEFTAEPVDGWWTQANAIYERVAPVERQRLRTRDPRAP